MPRKISNRSQNDIGTAEQQKKHVAAVRISCRGENHRCDAKFYSEQQRLLMDAQKSWLVEPEDAIANDVIKLIQVGMDRITEIRRNNNSRHCDLGHQQQLKAGSGNSVFGVLSPSNVPRTTTSWSPSVSLATSVGIAQAAAPLKTSHDVFLSDVNERLAAIGW